MTPLFATLLLIAIAFTYGSNMDYNFQRTRNQYLRFYIATKKSQTKHLVHEIHNFAIKTKEKTKKIYNSALSKYHDTQIAYYSLRDDDRELIEHIINMHF